MHRLPYSKILHNRKKSLLALAFNGHLQLLNTRTGAFVASTAPLLIASDTTDCSEPQLDNDLLLQDAHTDTVRTLAWDPTGEKLISSGEDKTLKIWNVDRWSLIETRPVVKRANAISCDTKGEKIFVADKFGDVYSHAMDPTSGEPDVILGHVSMITAMVVTADNRYIITADRDEHIRVSRNPAGYNIESFCLGHTDVITSLSLIPWVPSLLISGGGDSLLRIWDYIHGQLVHSFDLRSVVQKFLPSDEELEGHDSFMVNVIRISPETKDIFVGFIKTPAIAILRLSDTTGELIVKNIIETHTAVLDLDIDNDGNVWVALATDQGTNSLVSLYLYKNGMYEPVSDDHPLVAHVNQLGTALVEKLPDLYPAFHLRKSLNADDKDDDAIENEEPPVKDGTEPYPTKKRKLANLSSKTSLKY